MSPTVTATAPRDRTVVALLAALGALVLALAAFYPVGNADTFGHIAQGRQIVALGRVPRVDTFSFFRPGPQPWANYEWLADLALYAAWARAGASGLLAFKLALCAAAGALVVVRAARAAGARGGALCVVLLALCAPVVRFRLVERPHLIGLAFAALLLVGLDALADVATPARRARSVIALLAVVHIAWVNAHGSNLLGLALTALALLAAGRTPVARGRLCALLALELAASCASPFGPRILYDAVAHVARPEYRALVDEWRAVGAGDPFALRAAPWLLALATLVAAVALVRARTPRNLAAALSLALLAVMALRSLRFFAESFVLASPLLASAAAPALDRLTPRRARVALGSALALALLVAWPVARELPPRLAPGAGLALRDLPVGSGRFLATRAPASRLIAAVDDAWYAMFADPSVRVLVDGRVPFYGPEHVALVQRALGDGPQFASVVARFGVDAALLRVTEPDAQPALAYLATAPDWTLAFVEDRHALFVRARGSVRALHALTAGYDPAPLLSPALDERAARDELAYLAREPGGGAYRAWVTALLSLRPFARGAGRGGLRAPANPAERAVVRAAFDSLDIASSELGDAAPATVQAYLALAAVDACRLDRARDALERAGGASRETVLATEEIELREGHAGAVRAFLESARAVPDAAGDPWLAALANELADPPRCDP